MANLGTPLHEQAFHLNALLYGPPGTGKTVASLGAARRGRVLLIDAEAGAKAVALTAHGIPLKQIDIWPNNPTELTFEALEELTLAVHEALLKDPKAYSAVVVDSMTELTKRLLEKHVSLQMAKQGRTSKPRDRWLVELQDYGVAAAQMRLILRRLRDLPVHLVLTALERRDMDDDGLVSYGPAMSPAVAIDTMGLVDVVGHTAVEQIGGETFYVGSFVPLGRRKAKDRLGVLPPRMVDPSIDRILDYVDGKLDRNKDPRQQAIRNAAEGKGSTTKLDKETILDSLSNATA
jgi:hypothetical protein